MTVTAFATGDTLTEKVWATDWIDASIDYSFFSNHGLISPGHDNVIEDRRDLKNRQGDTIYLGEIVELTGSGVSGDNILEGSEEEMLHYDDSLIIDQVRNAVRLEGAMTEQRAAADLRKYMKSVLKKWMANKITQDMFTGLATSPTRIFYGGTATATTDITSSDKLSVTPLSKAAANCEIVTPEISPVTVDGMTLFVCITRPECVYDLRISDTVIQSSLYYAMERGIKNPLFTRAELYWNGNVIHSHRYVSTAENWGSSGAIHGCSSLFLGAHAGAIAFAKQKIWKEKLFDYDNSPGVCVGAIWGFTKLVFDSEDSATIVIRTYMTEITES